jgi:hypothetical protein
MTIIALIATPETDAQLRLEYNAMGSKARTGNEPRTAYPCDPNSRIGHWWFEGYDAAGHAAF